MEQNNPNTSGESQSPKPMALKVDENQAVATTVYGGDSSVKETTKRRRMTYRPSHKATFVGLAVISVFLLANVAGLWFLLRSQADTQEQLVNNGVTLSTDTLSQLGVNRDSVGEASELTIGPDTTFRSGVTIGNDVSIGGSLQLNSDFVTGSAKITNLQAGETQLESLNVNGDGTITTLNLRNDLNVVGTTRLQGQAIFSQLVTVNNNVNIAGNLSVGGIFAAKSFEASTLTAGQQLTVGGHIVTSGSGPTFAQGSALGSGGTASANGTDAAGTISVNVGTGAGTGLIGTVTFNRAYAAMPSVVVSPIGTPMPGLYVNRTTTGFSVSTTSALPVGSYAIDFIVMQ